MIDVVDKFVIIESAKTFTGIEKPLVFKENESKFEFAKSKIVYRQVTVPPPLYGANDPFEVEKYHRVFMGEILGELELRTGDWILMTDVDEIVSWHTVHLLSICKGMPHRLHLQMTNFMYSFEFKSQSTISWRPKAVRFPTGYNHRRESDFMLADCGWHCSFCFKRIRDFVFKMRAYSHADRVYSKSLLDPERIQRIVCEGKDVFDLLPEAYTYNDMMKDLGGFQKQSSLVDLPSYLLQEPDEFRFLLPGGCLRDY